MPVRYLIYIFMTVVLLAAAYHIFQGYFGAGRTGNYLKIRNRKDKNSQYCYRILPVYRLILRRMRIFYIIMLFLHIIFPLFYAIVFSVLIILSDEIEWWSRGKDGMRESVLLMWQGSGYSTWVLLCIILVAELILLLINLLVFPLIFDLAIRLVS